MKIIFAGTPDFAVTALSALIEAGRPPILVLTQPDRPSGRGMLLTPPPVKRLALESGIEVFQPTTLKDAAVQERLRRVGADVMVVAAYGLILPPAVLALPRLGCLNIHASLLPRWRGAAPIQRAILAGDSQSGVCIMQMEAGLDTGPVLLRESIPIGTHETAGSLHDRLAALGGRLLLRALRETPLPAIPQARDGITTAAKIDKAEAAIDWQREAAVIDRQIRAFNPSPGAHGQLAGKPVKLWQAHPVTASGVPGEILAADKNGIVVACGQGALCITELQKAGGKRLCAGQFRL